MSLFGDPTTRPFPAAQMRQYQDDTVAVFEAVDDVVVPVDVETSLDGRRREIRQPKALEPVVGVRVEGFLNRPTQTQATQRRIDSL